MQFLKFALLAGVATATAIPAAEPVEDTEEGCPLSLYARNFTALTKPGFYKTEIKFNLYQTCPEMTTHCIYVNYKRQDLNNGNFGHCNQQNFYGFDLHKYNGTEGHYYQLSIHQYNKRDPKRDIVYPGTFPLKDVQPYEDNGVEYLEYVGPENFKIF